MLLVQVKSVSLCIRCVVTKFDLSVQGIVFLVENELLRHTPEDIAQFLYKGEGLNKTAIGDYLGERWSVCVPVFSVLCLVLHQPL